MLKIISLKNQKEFDLVSKSGKKFHGKHFICVICCPEGELARPSGPQYDENQIYLGMKVSRKMGNAVKRNKIKRWFRDIVRKIAKDNCKYIGSSFILIPKKTITSITYSDLLEDFTSKFK